MAAASSGRFRPGGLRGVREPPSEDEWSKFSEAEKEQKMGEEWMRRAYGWVSNSANDYDPESKWIGDRLLGKGVAVFKRMYKNSHGVIGYERVVVKQASSTEGKRMLENESYFARLLEERELSNLHIMSPEYEEDVGTGADDTFDPVYVQEFAPETVARLYTRYCEEGNFNKWLENKYR